MRWNYLLCVLVASSALAQTSPATFIKGDFDGDGSVDVVARENYGTHNIDIRSPSKVQPGQYAFTPVDRTASDGSWSVEADGDFDGDGRSDIFLRNTTTGQNAIWFMDGLSYMRGAAVMSVADTSWQVGASGDFDHDGKADLVWRNSATGENAIWYMDSENYKSGVRILSVDDPSWTICGAADFNGDLQQDLVWRNVSTGANAIWLMAGSDYLQGVGLNSVTTVGDWRIIGTGDADHDGQQDIFWRQANAPDLQKRVNVWYMQGTGYRSGAFLYNSDGNFDQYFYGR